MHAFGYFDDGDQECSVLNGNQITVLFGYPPETEAVRDSLNGLVKNWQKETNGSISIVSYPKNPEGMEQIKYLLQLIGSDAEPKNIEKRFEVFERMFIDCRQSTSRLKYLLRVPVMGVIGRRVSILADRQIGLQVILGSFHKSFRSVVVQNSRIKELIKNIAFRIGRD